MPATGRGGSAGLPAGFGFIAFGIGGTVPLGSTRYAIPFAADVTNATEVRAQWPMPRNCTLQYLRAHCGQAAPTAPFSSVVRIRLDGYNTAITLTLDGPSGFDVADLTNVAYALEGQLVSLQLVTAGGGISFNDCNFSLGMF